VSFGIHRPQDARPSIRAFCAGTSNAQLSQASNNHLQRTKKELGAIFSRPIEIFNHPLDVPGARSTYRLGCSTEYPAGKTVSYEDIAKKIGAPSSARAVGHANGMNRIAIVIPCHRVINKSGDLGGYGGGLWRKKSC